MASLLVTAGSRLVVVVVFIFICICFIMILPYDAYLLALEELYGKMIVHLVFCVVITRAKLQKILDNSAIYLLKMTILLYQMASNGNKQSATNRVACGEKRGTKLHSS